MPSTERRLINVYALWEYAPRDKMGLSVNRTQAEQNFEWYLDNEIKYFTHKLTNIDTIINPSALIFR